MGTYTDTHARTRTCMFARGVAMEFCVMCAQELPCGHLLHSRCFAEYTREQRHAHTGTHTHTHTHMQAHCCKHMHRTPTFDGTWYCLRRLFALRAWQVRNAPTGTYVSLSFSAGYNYTCPLCSKSVGDMSVYFQMLDSLLASERLPPEYAGRMQQVGCRTRWSCLLAAAGKGSM